MYSNKYTSWWTLLFLLTLYAVFVSWLHIWGKNLTYATPTIYSLNRPTLLPKTPIVVSPTTGKASWIRYDLPNSCASRDYPKGTQLEVRMAGTEQPVIICTVRDYIENPDRIIDLNYDQFKLLASPDLGLIDVVINPI